MAEHLKALKAEMEKQEITGEEDHKAVELAVQRGLKPGQLQGWFKKGGALVMEIINAFAALEPQGQSAEAGAQGVEGQPGAPASAPVGRREKKDWSR